MDTPSAHRRYRFDRFELQIDERRLLRDGRPVPITARGLDLLAALVSIPGELATKEYLLKTVWPNLVVEESNLHVQLSALRKIIGASAVETVAGRGYRFLLPVMDAPILAYKHNLPQLLTDFIASEDQVARCARLLAESDLLTVVGVGGVGKTRLMLELARACGNAYPGGILLLDLVNESRGQEATRALARALDEASLRDVEPEQLAARCAREGPMLLLLDSCEHVLPASAELARSLLQSSPRLKVFATSREPLRIAGESTFRLAPLKAPDADQATNLEAMREYPSVQLFAIRARAVHPAFELDRKNCAHVARICRELDGLPLAIELGAALVRVISVANIADRIGDCLGLLRTADTTGVLRHRTLEATFDWSYQLLPSRERQVLRKIAEIPGSFSLDAAQAACAEITREAAEVPEVIGQLVEKSLVNFEPDRDRYRLLRTIRRWALTKMDAGGTPRQA